MADGPPPPPHPGGPPPPRPGGAQPPPPPSGPPTTGGTGKELAGLAAVGAASWAFDWLKGWVLFGLFLVAGYVVFMLIGAATGNLAWGAAGFCAVFAFGYLRGTVTGLRSDEAAGVLEQLPRLMLGGFAALLALGLFVAGF